MLPDRDETPDALGGGRKSRFKARIAERIREGVSEVILYELKDPRIGFVTVLEVDVTADVKEAVVTISVLGTPAQQQLTLQAIEHSRGYIQGKVGRRIQTRNTPILRFKLDEKTEKLREMDDILDRIRRERLARAGGAEEGERTEGGAEGAAMDPGEEEFDEAGLPPEDPDDGGAFDDVEDPDAVGEPGDATEDE
jgi:ribosome-binding factor A